MIKTNTSDAENKISRHYNIRLSERANGNFINGCGRFGPSTIYSEKFIVHIIVQNIYT